MFDRRSYTIDVLRALATFTSDKKARESFSSEPYYAVKRVAMTIPIYRENYSELYELEDDSADCFDELDDLISPINEIWSPPLEWLRDDPGTNRTWKKVKKLAAGCADLLESLPAPKKRPRVAEIDLPVEFYTSRRVDNPPTPEEEEEGDDGFSPNDTNWHLLRDELLNVMGYHGVVGPDEPADRPHFFIADDRYNEERYHYSEVYSTAAFTLDWLHDVMDKLDDYEGWGLAVKNIRGGYLLIFADKLMVTGVRFQRCKTPAAVLEAAKGGV